MDLAFCARLVKSAYETPFQTVASTGFYYEFRNDSLFIAMTGTDSKDDIGVDLSFWPNWGGCHSGFYSRSKAVTPKVVEIIETYASMKFIPLDFKIVLCGHSLSGALAQILCDLLKGRFKNLKAVTFGSPKVYLKGFAKNIKHIRCYHKDDPVPKLLPIFYCHTQTTYFSIGKDNSFISINAHYIENYIKELEQ